MMLVTRSVPGRMAVRLCSQRCWGRTTGTSEREVAFQLEGTARVKAQGTGRAGTREQWGGWVPPAQGCGSARARAQRPGPGVGG